MKRYDFRLENVLRVRKIQEDQAKAALQTANAQRTIAEQELAGRVEHYENRPPQAEGNQNISRFLLDRWLGETMARGIGDAEDTLEVASTQVDDRRHDWSQAAMKVSALERLDERGREEHRIESEREEAHVVDDLVVSRYRRLA